ncbi:DUF3500 domain-containing protein [Pelagicoccus albus]|uniref:DUF3500 domain-containing protein n=1 Tax=Pelagicoccus albus TaxID=415222 RepID=A0A7X1B8G6_9BACT|nr:DUF3500 domain-containing protein [Pelagicoccus albus]MBC2607501.1 DUF3500 domain-containing protein [Pelagicoccus albus]
MKTLRKLTSTLLILIASASSFDARADTEDVVDAANAFLDLLSSSQKTESSSNSNSTCLFSATLSNVTTWSNVPISASTRNGLQFSTLSSTQYAAALAVAEAALSDMGYTLMEEVRLSDAYISGEEPNANGTTSSMWGYSKYFIAFVGTPSTTEPWTLQLGGHHLAFNITYNGDYKSASPQFTGTEPNSFEIDSVTYRPLGTQRDLLVSLRSTLSSDAALSGSFSDLLFAANGTGQHDTIHPKSYPTSGRGQLFTELSSDEQELVIDYIESWVGSSDPSLSDYLLADYLSDAALAETYVGYGGSSASMSSSGSYFRVDGPRVWIEYVVQGGVYDRSGVHDHGVYRDKLADYGAVYGATTIATTIRPPEITTQPTDQEISFGSSLSLSVSATGTGSDLSYQWLLDGETIADANSASYALTDVSEADAGVYSVVISNTAGVATSETVSVSVIQNDPFQDWLDQNGISDTGDDSDGDGFDALQEWFLGGDPTVADQSIGPVIGYSSTSQELVLSFNMIEELGNVSWQIEQSEDLVEWSEVASSGDSLSFAFGSVSDGLIPVQATLANVSDKLFLRLVIAL